MGNFDHLKKVMKFGYKYRLQNHYITWRKIKRDIMETIENLKIKIIGRNKGDNNDLDDWEEIVKQRINSKIRSLQTSHDLSNFTNDIDQKVLRKQINNIHKHFVITTIDKAGNNFAIICKKFYINIIKKELGIRGNIIEGNDVYTYCEHSSVQDIINSQGMQLEQFHRDVKVENRKIPKLFMNPKFHKRPYKYRFIAGASKAITKELAVDVNLCLKLIKKAHKGYCKTIYNRTGYNYFWSVDNSKEVIDKLNKIKNPLSVHTYDFSTLYTNLPLEIVKDELFEIIDRYFDINERKSNKYIVLDHFNSSSWFSSSCNSKKASYDREKLKMSLEYLLFNSYVRFGPYVFKQVKGIPMGGNASPLIADLFLANLEFKYMDRLVSSKSPDNIRLAKKLSNNSRYIDDIAVCNMNDVNTFLMLSKDISPNSIPLTAGNANNHADTFLDLDIQIEGGNFITKVYHKVDDFDFEVVSFPFPTSNISDFITYDSFYSQLIRFSSICSKLDDFTVRCKRLTESLIQRGYVKCKFKNIFMKFLVNYHDINTIKYDTAEIKRFCTAVFG